MIPQKPYKNLRFPLYEILSSTGNNKNDLNPMIVPFIRGFKVV